MMVHSAPDGASPRESRRSLSRANLPYDLARKVKEKSIQVEREIYRTVSMHSQSETMRLPT